ncbi:hypothetical protein EPUS_06567 [Endocarpon pusillum Z07020]|uniref:CRAL-TRIO domain-containing protein n=1 Tax=Endocarpon pusillum (strain Z07020 / HMAS-L-300199) TaxID=1263415 RepID=U1GMI3_ENDPU|nr:uncharacterized protein EPUS_06567 [Endocarpon pusillum Z07020]ERF73106.1 hypothetical protein EPUS_06567 [Endocarpon pusillum Z07020]
MSLFKTWTGQSQRSQLSQQSNHGPQEAPSPAHNQTTSPSPPQPQRYSSFRNDLYQVTSNRSNADPFAGHLNHLTPYQESQLEKFKSILHQQGLYRPASQDQPASHDDPTVLRYLRARKFDINGAYAQFRDTEKWSKENKITELYENFDVQFYEKARRMYPQWTGHRDKRGIPVYVYVIKHLDSKNVNTYAKETAAYKAKLPYHSSLSTPAKMLPLFALYENLLRFTIPLCSSLEGRPNPEVPITNSNNIVDISGVGLKQFWNLKSHMQESSVLATAHYPETLDRIFIIGAPSFFPTVWGWIKRWFDPVTVNKIFILGHHEVKARLSEYIHPDDFPKKYGGNLDWDIGMDPHLDQVTREAVERNGGKGWIGGPCLWEQNQRVPVGTVNGKPRRPAKLEPVAAPAKVESTIAPAPSTIEPAPLPVETPSTVVPPLSSTTIISAEAAQAPPPSLNPAQAEPLDSSNPPSMTHSRSTASTFITTPPAETTTAVPPTAINGTTKPPEESESLVVANGEVLPAGTGKPPMERFVTAAEDLSTLRTPVNSVS